MDGGLRLLLSQGSGVESWPVSPPLGEGRAPLGGRSGLRKAEKFWARGSGERRRGRTAVAGPGRPDRGLVAGCGPRGWKPWGACFALRLLSAQQVLGQGRLQPGPSDVSPGPWAAAGPAGLLWPCAPSLSSSRVERSPGARGHPRRATGSITVTCLAREVPGEGQRVGAGASVASRCSSVPTGMSTSRGGPPCRVPLVPPGEGVRAAVCPRGTVALLSLLGVSCAGSWGLSELPVRLLRTPGRADLALHGRCEMGDSSSRSPAWPRRERGRASGAWAP